MRRQQSESSIYTAKRSIKMSMTAYRIIDVLYVTKKCDFMIGNRDAPVPALRQPATDAVRSLVFATSADFRSGG